MTRARRLCPQATVLDRRPRRATPRSPPAVMEVFRSVTPLVEPLSLDEAFLDVAGAVRRLGGRGRDRRARSAPGSPTSRASPARSGSRDEVRRQARLDPRQARRAARRAAPTEVVAFLHPLPVGALWGVGEKTEEAADRGSGCAPSATSRTPRRAPCERALGAGRRRPPARAGLGPRRAPGGPARAGQEHRRRGDLRHRRRRPGGHPPRAAPAVRADGGPAARRRAGRPHRRAQGPVRRLHHDHPVAAPCAPDRRRPGGLRHRPRPLRRARAGPGPASGWSASGSRAWSTPRPAPQQLLLGAREHGWREAEQAVDRRRGGSAPGRCGRVPAPRSTTAGERPAADPPARPRGPPPTPPIRGQRPSRA